MVSLGRVAVAGSSTVLRLAAFIFLRWIPGHHFPPIILTSLVIYLYSLYVLSGEILVQEASVTVVEKITSEDEVETTVSASELEVEGPPREDAERSVLNTLLTGLPSARSPRATALTTLVNILLALLALDFVFRGLLFYPSSKVAFSRVGYVSPTTANLLVREPDTTKLPLKIHYQEAARADSSKWAEEGTIYALTKETDFTASAQIKGLKPYTQYRYKLSNNMTGSFVTAALPSSDAANRLSFLTSSCIKPNFPYNPFSHPLRIPGLEQMSKVVARLPRAFRPSFMLFLGDFIYIDVPRRFGSSINHYRSEYRRVYASPSWSVPEAEPARQLPWLHTLDDHEIENDWHKGNLTPPYPAAVDPFMRYHVSVNPPIPPTPFAKPENSTYFSFVHGPASFFMLDTRTYRSEPDQPDSTILGSAQLQSLLTYLARPESSEVRWKIVASSVPITKNWHVGTSDTWGGFLHERQSVLEAMWRAERELGVRVVVLSGDRHEFGATRFPDPMLMSQSPPSDDEDTPSPFTSNTAGEGIHEFSVGPLSMFYLPIRTYRQTDNTDVAIKYIPDGNSKFGLIDISVYDDEEVETVTKTGQSRVVTVPSSILTYSLYVDGKVVWKYRLSAPLPEKDPAASIKYVRNGRWPPGRVVRDERPLDGWDVRVTRALGWVEETARGGWDWVLETYFEKVDKFIRAERLD